MSSDTLPSATADSSQTQSQKTFAIVSAVYNVAPYLDDFIRSIETQDYPLDDVEIVMVDDGSTDSSRSILEGWAARRPELVRVITKENGGQSSARNLGLTLVSATWVTFIDPDDMIGDGYLKVVRGLIQRYPQSPLVATNRIFYDEATGTMRDEHPLREMFIDGDKKVELDRFPQYFWHHVGAGFFKLDEIRRLGLTFDERVRPNFEDGHFCCHYLFGTSQTITFAASAVYVYRRRADQSSTLQGSWLKPEKFTHVPKYGYLDCLRVAKERFGAVPEWLQNDIIYDLTWYFTTEDSIAGSRTAATGEVGAEFVRHLREIRGYLDQSVIESFSVRHIQPALRDLLLHAFSDEPWHSSHIELDRYDVRAKQVRATYRYVGEAPSEEVLLRGLPVEPPHSKTRVYSYFDAPLMSERVLWLSGKGTLRVRLDGTPMPLRRRPPEVPRTYLRPLALERLMGVPQPQTSSEDQESARKKVKRLKMIGGTAPVRRRFRDAWVLMDRTHDASDNGERLFEYLRRNRKDINAWFVIEPNTPDWHRLRRGRNGNRIVALGSTKWKLLMMHCVHLISSHAEAPIVSPEQIRPLRPSDWKFTFLQHGVIKDDLSRWLNTKWMIDLFVTSTEKEHASIVGDGPYRFTTKEVRLTGLPRFDRLLRLSNKKPRQDLLLVAPTWRRWLNAADQPATQRKDVVADFTSSDYARSWTEFLSSPALREAAERRGLGIGFLPHPNVQPALDSLHLPKYVKPLRFVDHDVQELFARAALIVTDYSSMAFDMAHLSRPVVYFQFDEERVLHGDHSFRPSYFDYRRDGFGPVATQVEEAVAAVGEMLGDETLRDTYAQRAANTFRLRDGQCCKRVVKAIERL